VKWSDREIARRCCVDHKFVSKQRKDVTGDFPSEKPTERTYTTKHGTTATMNTSSIGKASVAEQLHDHRETAPQERERFRGLCAIGCIPGDVFRAMCDRVQGIGYRVQGAAGAYI